MLTRNVYIRFKDRKHEHSAKIPATTRSDIFKKSIMRNSCRGPFKNGHNILFKKHVMSVFERTRISHCGWISKARTHCGFFCWV